MHDKGLQVLEASCDEPSGGTYLCQVTFLSTADPNQRLYFDVIAVARGGRRMGAQERSVQAVRNALAPRMRA